MPTDNEYEGGCQVSVPYSGRGLIRSEEAFNYFHRSCSVSLEQSLSILTNKFGIIWSLMRYKISTSASIVVACCQLHNFILYCDKTYSWAVYVENHCIYCLRTSCKRSYICEETRWERDHYNPRMERKVQIFVRIRDGLEILILARPPLIMYQY